MGKGWTAADVPQGRTSPTAGSPRPQRPAAGVTIPEPVRSSSGEPKPKVTPEQQRPARLRPVCQTASWPGFEGYRVVMHGLNEEQHRAVTEAAAGAGIHVIQNETNHV